MNESTPIGSLLNDIEMNCDPPIGGEECNRFSLDCLSLIRHKLPPIAVEGLTLVTGYVEGRVPLKAVVNMLVKCWEYLDEHHHNVPINDPTVSAIRAVIFPLSAQKNPRDRNIVDHLSFFLMLVNNLEPHDQEEEALLRRHFSACLEAS